MKKFSFNSIIRKQQPKGVFIVAIWKSGHRYLSISIVIGIGIAKNLFLPSEFFLKKQNFFFLFLVLSYCISTTLLQILISLRFPIHPFNSVHWCSRKLLFEHLEASVHWCFKKTTATKISAYFAYSPAKHPGWSNPGIAPKSSLEQPFCRQGFIRAI